MSHENGEHGDVLYLNIDTKTQGMFGFTSCIWDDSVSNHFHYKRTALEFDLTRLETTSQRWLFWSAQPVAVFLPVRTTRTRVRVKPSKKCCRTGFG